MFVVVVISSLYDGEIHIQGDNTREISGPTLWLSHFVANDIMKITTKRRHDEYQYENEFLSSHLVF